MSFPGDSDSKKSACNAEGQVYIPSLKRSPREGNGYPLQYCCLENSMYKGAWQASPWGHKESDMTSTSFLFWHYMTLRSCLSDMHRLSLYGSFISRPMQLEMSPFILNSNYLNVAPADHCRWMNKYDQSYLNGYRLPFLKNHLTSPSCDLKTGKLVS